MPDRPINPTRFSMLGTAAAMGVVGSVPMVEQASLQFINPFTGKSEPYVSEASAHVSMFKAAAKRINDLEEQIEAIKSHLVL